MTKWLYGILLALVLAASASADKVAPTTDNTIKAAFIPLSGHCDCKGICDRTFNVPAEMIFSVQQICTCSELPGLTASGKVDVVIIMCPTAAEKVFSGPSFRMTDGLRKDLHKLAINTRGITDAKAKSTSKASAPTASADDAPEPEQISEKLQKLINARLTVLQRYAQDPLVINIVKEVNAKEMTLDKIKKLDSQWINITDDGFADEILSSNISKFLRKKIRSNKLLYTEAFLCDRQGATVGAYPRTSDYWQGDEAKFTKCFSSEEILIGPLEFDESTNSYSVQVSVPVKDSGETIGVLVVGLRNIK